MDHVVDTNKLVQQADVNSADRPVALQALTRLTGQSNLLYTVPQNIVEFWVVATRPQAVNGLGLSTAEANAERARLQTLSPVLPDPSDLCYRWVSVVNQLKVSGKPAHDARIVAAMLAHGITRILTFNGSDFRCFAPLGIVVTDPAQV